MAQSRKLRAQQDKALPVNVHLVHVHHSVCIKTQHKILMYFYTCVGDTVMARSRKLRAQGDQALDVNVHFVYVHPIVCINTQKYYSCIYTHM